MNNAVTERSKQRLIMFKRPQITIGSCILFILILLAVFANQISPYDPNQQNLRNKLEAPTLDHPLGTDRYGRDVLSRIIYGGRISLLVGICSVTIGGLIGTILGIVSGFLGGSVDLVIMRFVDALLAFPTALVALAIVASLGSDVQYVILAISISIAPRFARIVRGSTFGVKILTYVSASRALGANKIYIMKRHIIPNILSPLIVAATFNVATAILVEAFLGFLGLGVQPPTPTWGNLINDGLNQIRITPTLAIYPGLVITLAVLSFNMMGDGLRDLLDPKLRR